METRDPRLSPPGLGSQDDDGLWMKLDSSSEAAYTYSQSVTSGEKPQAAPAVITRYYSVMDDEGADDVFIPPPPTSMAPLLPTEGSTDATSNNSSVTLSNEAADATEAKANPSGLDWHHGEKQFTATQVEEVAASTAQTSKESMDIVSVSSNKNSTLATDQDPASADGTGRVMERYHDPCERYSLDRGDEEPNEEAEDNVIVSDGQEDWKEREEDVADVTSDDQELVDTRSLNYNLTKNDWVRRESDTSETQGLQLPMSDRSEETKGEQGDGSWKIATDIQQGEQLLQRLQLVQQRQDVRMSERALTSQQVVQKPGDEEKSGPGTEVDNMTANEVDQSRVHTVTDEGAETDLMEQDTEAKPWMSLSTMHEEPQHQRTVGRQAGSVDDDQSDSWMPQETSTFTDPVLPTRHRFSAAETSMEFQEAAQGKQNLQRAGGVFNLADDLDVLEIPFKTNFSLEPIPPNVGQGQRSDWQFSEQKMQKEISQETQRELVLVNQGKIPGGYSKGEIRQLKETKLLFEAFQQVNTEGPTRHRKSPTLAMKGHVYPSVLERTRSLEMFSLKSCPVTRAHSLRLYKSETSEQEKSPENIRSRSPTGIPRDKSRLCPYPKQDKHLHVYRSMDSISPDVSASAVETKRKTREGHARAESPILKRNPFFKLRPALALQPEVEKDIREAREREEELRRQRCTLYGENRQKSQEEDRSQFAKTLRPG